MKLYHGTTATIAKEARRHGLHPRGDRPSNWDAESRHDCIYLTEVYAAYFANAAAAETGDDWGIIEVNIDVLDKNLLLPDEDALEQAFRQVTVDNTDDGSTARRIAVGIQGMTMEERTAWFRDNLESFAGIWENSVRVMGTCCYRGTIPPEALTRIVTYNPSSNRDMTRAAIDPIISIANFHLMRRKYWAINRWLLGHKLELADFLAVGNLDLPMEAKELETITECAKNQQITVLK